MDGIVTTGRFVKQFNRFVDGLTALREVSSSASQALGEAASEEEAIIRLAVNVGRWARPTGNGVGWGMCAIQIRADGVDYTTSGGLGFGWSVYSGDYHDLPEYDESYFAQYGSDNTWWFYVEHPMGADIPSHSSLRRAAAEHGWLEKLSNGHLVTPVVTEKPEEPRIPFFEVAQASEVFLGPSTLTVLLNPVDDDEPLPEWLDFE